MARLIPGTSRPALPKINQIAACTLPIRKSVSLPSNRACLHRERCLPVRFGASKNMKLVQARRKLGNLKSNLCLDMLKGLKLKLKTDEVA